MSDLETYTLVTSSSHPKAFDDWAAINGAAGFNPHTSFEVALRRQYSGLALTVTTSGNGTSSIAF